MLKDIRELANDKEAYAAELKKRWSGLLSYRYIGRNHGRMNNGEIDMTVTLRRDLRNSTGGLLVAPLMLASPEGASKSDLDAVPNPVIHSCHILDPGIDVQRIEVFGQEVLKEGVRMNYTRSRIVDADNHARVLALTEGQGVVIGKPPEGLEKMPEVKLEIVDSPDLPPLWQAFGAWRHQDGHWMLPELSAELASPDAALHIGPQHIVLETAAVDAAEKLAGTSRLQMESWHVMFLARGKKGPFRVDASAYAGGGDRIGVRVTLYDEGDAGRSVSSGSGVLRTVA